MMKDYQKFLKRQNKSFGHYSEQKWTLPNIEAGFEKFYEENGHYPSSTQCDKYEYLPSSKQIQRVFGGIQKIRKDMNLEHEIIDHNKGEIRSKIAYESMTRATSYEEDYYKYLIKQIPEVNVHEHKVLRFNGSKTDTDFFIYLPNSNNGIAVDVFYAMDILNLLKQVAIKIPKYKPMPYETFFVSINNQVSQEEIDNRIFNKKISIPENIKVYNVDYFNSNILPKISSLFK